MFLFVFQVDNGMTFTLDLNLSTETIQVLKQNIYVRTGIPIDKQALLLSGGETLFDDAKVSSYRSAGTETNPIFLFNKEVVDQDNPPFPVIDNVIDADMKTRIQSCFNMEPSFNTVMTRSELAQQLYAVAQSNIECCQKLIQDQHFQHQGWNAVLANIEDLSKVVANKLEALKIQYEKFKSRGPIYNQSIDRLQTDLEVLHKMPLLPSLVEPSLKNRENKEDLSLADWIGFRWNSLRDVGAMVNSVLEFQHKSHEEFMASIERDKKTVLETINSKEIKEINGLQNRLQMLNSSCTRAAKLASELNEFAQAFHSNQIRVTNMRDNSILPDLCATHEQQLRVVGDKYSELSDIRDRCAAAKREFCGVIHRRLQWASHISKLISSLSHKQTLWISSFHRMEKFINVFDQINRAPTIYLSFIGEIYRRRHTSQKFLTWACAVANQSRDFYDKEIELRRDFEGKTSQHFLKALFWGMGDEPPQFANQAPEPFDDKLPEITECDIIKLINLFPQYRSLLETPEDVPFQTDRLNFSPKRRIVTIEDEPKEESCQDQLEEPIDEPIDEPTEANKDENVEAPIDEPIEAPISEPIEAPVDEPIDTPIDETIETPIDEPVKESCQIPSQEQQPHSPREMYQTPNQTPPQTPVQEPSQEPIQAPKEEPCQEATEETNPLPPPITSTPDQEKISYFSCDIGDLVLLTFNPVHNCYIAFVNSNFPHFLHQDCLEPLGFLTGNGKEVPAYGFGIITEKAFCQASKPSNRYNVPINTRFYRFKAKPWPKIATVRRPPIPMIPVVFQREKASAMTLSMDPNSRSVLPCELHFSSHAEMQQSQLSPSCITISSTQPNTPVTAISSEEMMKSVKDEPKEGN
ncbi:RB1-inducible coiled-coil protein 1-like [Panonychus citri]|uniref:RB1-inducible coiled-coil protein 1-like n=1 Tax=Panonychus citri TaxID=50023 RepID=UPI002307F26A|nr:RB1-inducible coiled-coil protein 1-like [Panonychus citri]XP_053204357.1 RB1-inducible coiled-coil protein 1-like [Panonychus citri]